MGYRKIIIIGENNLCRSFMAETILRGIIKRKRILDIEVISRGLVVLFSEPVSPMAAATLRKHGYKIEDFRSAPLTEKDLESADLALTMTAEQTEQVKANFKSQTACMSVGTFIDTEEGVPEVQNDTPEAFEKCFCSIESFMEAVADRVIGELLP